MASKIVLSFVQQRKNLFLQASSESEIIELKKKIQELEKEENEIHGSYQFKLQDLSGKIQGILNGRLKRYLETALDAVTKEPPAINVIIERLEESLKILSDEYKHFLPPKTSSEAEIVELKKKVQKLEKYVIQIEDGYIYKLHDLRGKIRSILDGQLKRYLETALDAATAKPFNNFLKKVIIERLEDSLKILSDEYKHFL